jgi:WD40 repeat protein
LLAVDRRPQSTVTKVKGVDGRDKIYDEVIVGGADGTPRLYKIHRVVQRVIGDDANKVREFGAMPGRIFSARFNSDGSRFVVGSSLEGKGEVRVYQSGMSTDADPSVLALAGLPVPGVQSVSPILFVPHGPPVGTMVSRFEMPSGGVYAVAYHPEGKQVAAAGFDGMVRLIDANTGKLIKEFGAAPLGSQK